MNRTQLRLCIYHRFAQHAADQVVPHDKCMAAALEVAEQLDGDVGKQLHAAMRQSVGAQNIENIMPIVDRLLAKRP